MSLEVLWGSQTEEETWEGKICFPLFFFAARR